MAVPTLFESPEGAALRTRRTFEPVLLRTLQGQNPRQPRRIASTVLASLAFVLSILFVFDSSGSERTTRIETLASILCCEGCCMSSAQTTVAKGGFDELQDGNNGDVATQEPARSTVLHFAGQKEIDYTASGHHVAQHMENALNELDDLEDHVQSGMPKYLKESAVQREADLMNHKFSRDLEGSGQKKTSIEHHQKAAALTKSSQALHKADHHDTKNEASKQSKKKFQMQTGQKMVDQVVAAAKMDADLKKKDDEADSFLSQSESRLNKNMHAAEKEAEHATQTQYGRAPLSKSSATHTSDSTGRFVPITSKGLHARSSAGEAGDREEEEEDDKDEAIVRELAEGRTPPVARIKSTSPAPTASSTKKTTLRAHSSAKQEHKAKEPAGGGEGAGGEEKLNGVLGRIDRLIGGYTGGASQHSTFFKHFDSDLSPLFASSSSSSSLAAGAQQPASASLTAVASAPAAVHAKQSQLREAATAGGKGAPGKGGAELKTGASKEGGHGGGSGGGGIQLAEVKLGVGEVVGRKALEEEQAAAEGERREAEGSLRAALFRKRQGVSEEGRDAIVNLRMSA